LQRSHTYLSTVWQLRGHDGRDSIFGDLSREAKATVGIFTLICDGAKMATDADYVLGTHDNELARLGLQHRVWRPVVLDCWQRAGITEGKRVLDVGAGPGYAAIDLAELVGPSGEVVAVERSPKFVAAMEGKRRMRGLKNLTIHQLDLMSAEMPPGVFDFAWCRWVLCFVSKPEVLVKKIAGSLRKKGLAIFHEYAAYATWSFLPQKPHHEKFVGLVMQSWRDTGGEPDIGLQLPRLLSESGFALRSIRPHVFAIRPGDEMWHWPATFIESGPARLQEIGYLDATFVAELRSEFTAAEKDENTVMLTPLVVEVIAARK
jgi:SAM-dependent methyltransferase